MGPQVKIAEALTGFGVPFNTSHGPTWGPVSLIGKWPDNFSINHALATCHMYTRPQVRFRGAFGVMAILCRAIPLFKLCANLAEECRILCAQLAIVVFIACPDVV